MKRTLSLVAAGLVGLGFAACKKNADQQAAKQAATAAAPQQDGDALPESTLAVFQPLPAQFDSPKNPPSEAKIALGRQLYYDARLSRDQKVACNSCHLLDQFGVDGHKTSTGFKGQLGGRNAPTVYNAAGLMAQFWDGRAPDVEEQAKGPLLNPVEMAMPSEAAVVEVVKSMPEYVAAFKAAFPGEADPVSFEHIAQAIGAFERRLVTPSRFDKFLLGDKTALSAEERHGLKTFIDTGCIACHNGVGVGGNSYQKLGAAVPWPDQTSDLGRHDVTKKDEDKLVFRVPTLRNIEHTAPYFHNGSVATLPEAVKLMAKHQLGKDLSDADTAAIVTFLKTLSGTPDAKYIAEPTLPKSTATTPKPVLN